MNDVYCEIKTERKKQDEKWGEQNHPNGTGPRSLEDMSYRCTTADAAKGLCDRMFSENRGTWAHVLYEEFAESMEETNCDTLRQELLQVAAVAIAWIECIDRKREK